MAAFRTVLVIIFWLWSTIVYGYDFISQYPNQQNETFQFYHLAIDKVSGQVYAGSLNALHQLKSDLKPIHVIRTGPKPDNPMCHASGCDSEIKTSLVDNVNKILVIDQESRLLIACGSVAQGSCYKYKLGDISAEPEFLAESVAANDADASTYAFIGPERYMSWDRSNVLYVGTTFTNNGDYRHDVPAISSRDLMTLRLAQSTFSKQSSIQIDVKYRDNFLVQYVYGFNASDYAYFLIIQKHSHLAGNEELGYVSRLARTCVNDDNYNSYTEVTLECSVREENNGKIEDVNYNLVQDAKIARAGATLATQLGIEPGDSILVTSFSPSKTITNEPVAKSAICVFSLQEIEIKFNENVHMCFNGSTKSRNMGYISGMISDGKCPSVGSVGNILNFCEVGLKISGLYPIRTSPVIYWNDTLVSSVTMSVTGLHTVAFLGTNKGKLKKVLIDVDKAIQYASDELLPGQRILPDTTLSPFQRSLYVLARNTIVQIPTEKCTEHSDCSSCLESNDPHCGWCSLEKRCTVQSMCQKGTQSAPRWLSRYTGQQCIDFEQIMPDKISMNEVTTVQLVIRTLPELPFGDTYKCVFGNAPPIDAAVTTSGLACPTPDLKHRPKILPNQDHAYVPLSVHSSETNKDFVSRNFAFYDCSKHTTCQSCILSEWACNWCIYDNRCTHDTSVCQRTIISGESNPTKLLNHGIGHCPRIRQHKHQILLPNNVPKELELEVENLPHLQPGHTGFQCIVSIEQANMIVPARVESNHFIVCDKTTYSYEEYVGEYNVSVKVVWNHKHYIDTINITLYKCEILGSHREHADCSLCITRNSVYQCTWCGNSCSYSESCLDNPVTECPKPRIDMIKPLSGPIEGGTIVTIEGSNLGLRVEEVTGKVRIGEVPCEIVDFEVSVSITCRTGPSNGSSVAPVIVENDAGYTESSVLFSYKNIKLQGIYPALGPVSGGTQLAIGGQHLNIGSAISAYLDELPCSVNKTQTSNSRLICITPKANMPRVINTITVAIDNANRTLMGDLYNYTADPTIMEIKPLKSFVSGGRMITVHGTNLNTIQKPLMKLYHAKELEPVNYTACVVLNSNQMECPSPAINKKYTEILQATASQTSTPQIAMKVGFVMDYVETMHDLEKYFNPPRTHMVFVEDPHVYHFPNKIKSYKGDPLVIEGENLIRASDESDVVVTIGTQPCNVTSLTMQQLLCTPPEIQPMNTDENGVQNTDINLPMVVVKIGKNLRFPIGYLHYELLRNYNFPPEAIAGIAAGTFFLVLIFMIVLVMYRRRSTKAEREYKRIQIQMDTLESNVRLECKLAFAELQTDMSDLAADLEHSGIPTLDHVNYVMKVFFPGVSDHPILNVQRQFINTPRTNYDAAMIQFEQLLNNKCFLLSFIDTLEAQKSFNIRDKVNVASLLMIILMGKMEYATDILKSLLLRLIDKSVCNKHPQLMLRRTESVVEKMLTNWMALCMYYYLKDYAGSSLFLLFKAIKHQIEKGVVDAITHEARYSLSEEKLLKEQIDYQIVTLHIVQDDFDEKVQCKVLDCDSISQVKSKILDALFKNTPFSMRPSVHEVDLEWRHGRGGHVTLQDEDVTTKTVNSWRKLNTLAHYGVKESAIMSLISRQNDSFNTPYKIPCKNCTGIYCTNSHIRVDNNDLDHNVHFYHLVRPIEYHNIINKTSEHSHKAIPEIFLTRLLSTKGTVHKFVDDFFSTILTVNEVLPPAVKWLFDLFDEAARTHGIMNPEVVHAWKSNSLPLRFWVNLIKNPDFIFDINKTATVDSSLSVIAQTFMDACSLTEHRLCKDSPSNKLLFAKDLPTYRDMVIQFYQAVSQLPQVTDQELSTSMQQLSVQQLNEFDTLSALKELYIYVSKYREQIILGLEMDPLCNKMHLAHKLDNVACTMEGDPTSIC
ncbi:plexin-B [Cydia pomonella]|uniref:plexin-B n=1 Tax=Cydia pomonella TaxID=82600 RepID=UPI002ADE5A52|nr:plexin-B [Cydia pomonella]